MWRRSCSQMCSAPRVFRAGAPASSNYCCSRRACSHVSATSLLSPDVLSSYDASGGGGDDEEQPLDQHGTMYHNPMRDVIQEHCATMRKKYSASNRAAGDDAHAGSLAIPRISIFWISQLFAVTCAETAAKSKLPRHIFPGLLDGKITSPPCSSASIEAFEVGVPVVSGSTSGRASTSPGPGGVTVTLLNKNHPQLHVPYNVDLRSAVNYCGPLSCASTPSAATNPRRSRAYSLMGGGFQQNVLTELLHEANRRQFISQCWLTLEEAEHLGWELIPAAQPYRIAYGPQFRSPHIATRSHEGVREQFEKRMTYVNTEDVATEIDFAEYFTFDHRMLDVANGFSLPSTQVMAFREHLRQVGLLRGYGRVPSVDMLAKCCGSSTRTQNTPLAAGGWQWADLYRYVGTEPSIRQLLPNLHHGGGLRVLPDAVPFVPQTDGQRQRAEGVDGLFVPAQTNDPAAMIVAAQKKIATSKKQGSGKPNAFVQRRFQGGREGSGETCVVKFR
jgi:hypothetical protein